MARLLAPTSILLAVILLAMNVPALAVDRTFQTEVENSLKGTVPSNWWLRASWRDQTLVVFVSPPVQESFDLWYDTPRQKETLENLCKAIPVTIWNQIPPDQDIAVEQVVGVAEGNSQQNRGNVELPSTQRLGRRHRHQQQNNHAGADCYR